MKRQKTRRRTGAKKQPQKSSQKTRQTRKVDRRDVLSMVRNWGLFAAVVAGGGWYLVDEVMATIAEQDLSKIGNGIPTVVQIHDPQCPRCIELQREARQAMEEFDGDELQYLVANIRSEKGQALAAKHRVGHITLLLLDGKGERRETLHGNSQSDYLKRVFRAHTSQFARTPG